MNFETQEYIERKDGMVIVTTITEAMVEGGAIVHIDTYTEAEFQRLEAEAEAYVQGYEDMLAQMDLVDQDRAQMDYYATHSERRDF